ncbi:MAG: hypothetical protein DRQ06_02500 [Candidatus Hydrothermota bacterium]|nr:MAG: hypothetical protein DRQ06_02500 [Candidatus Hydrothermae bacterium]
MRRSKRKYEGIKRGRVNIVPLVDVSLSLLIMFVVSLPFVFETGIFVNAPGVVATKGKPSSDVKVNIYLKSDGSILLNDEPVDRKELEKLLPELLRRSADRKVIVSADTSVDYERVIEVLDLSKEKGAAELVILRRKG